MTGDLVVAAVVPSEADVDFEGFFGEEYPRLFSALHLLTGDAFEADDLAQESMLRAYERWDRIKGMDSPLGYVYRTALNLNRSRLRKVAVRARRVFAEVPGEDPSAAAEARSEVHRALGALSRPQREALILVEWLGFGSEEAAGLLGIDPASVRGRIHRAKKVLRERVGGSR
jgi:RNA polymerase sigma factor (sigma-70 family)